jgi:hypothetical protein
MTATEELRRSLQAQLEQLDREAELLRNALAALDAPVTATDTPDTPSAVTEVTEVIEVAKTEIPASRAMGNGHTVTRPRARARVRRDPVPAEKLERLLAESDGLTSGELADLADGDRPQVLTLLRELESAQRVRRTGERRSTRWHAITDEDRIRERAAELERQSRAARNGDL